MVRECTWPTGLANQLDGLPRRMPKRDQRSPDEETAPVEAAHTVDRNPLPRSNQARDAEAKLVDGVRIGEPRHVIEGVDDVRFLDQTGTSSFFALGPPTICNPRGRFVREARSGLLRFIKMTLSVRDNPLGSRGDARELTPLALPVMGDLPSTFPRLHVLKQCPRTQGWLGPIAPVI
jgi:hypothetical protein